MSDTPSQQPAHGDLAPASEYLAAIVESSEDAIVSKNLEGIVTSWNRAAERMFGYKAEEIVGRPISIIAAPELRDEIPGILNRIRRGERIEHYEAVRIHKDGHRVYVSLTISPVRDASGRIIGASKVARDISDRKRSEQERSELLARERAGREAAERATALHEEAERNLGFLVDASHRLLESFEVPEVVARTLELAQRFVSADAYAFWRLNAAQGVWTLVDSVGLSGDFPREQNSSADSHFNEVVLAIEDLENWAPARRADNERESIRSLMSAPMRIRGKLSGALSFYFRKVRQFSETERRIAGALANLAAAATSSAESYQAQKRLRDIAQKAAARSDLLAQASVVLGSSLDYSATLKSVARLVVAGFADWCVVDMIAADGKLQRLAVEQADPSNAERALLVRQYQPGFEVADGTTDVCGTGIAELYASISGETFAQSNWNNEYVGLLRQLAASSMVVAPMILRGQPLGAITFIIGDPARGYTTDDLAIAEQLALRAALAVDNAKLFVASERDRAESRAAVEALRESNTELEQFAYVSSHDLQEPLRTIASFTQLLAKRYRGKLDPDADEFLGFIVDGDVRMSVLIDGLLSFSRITRSEAPLSEPTDAEAALAAALRTLATTLAESGAVVTHDPLPSVLADPLRLILVFQNLVGNAIKYRRPETPRIHVSASRDEEGWRFSVADNGIGISREYWGLIFGLFKRLHGRDIPGTGIGLSTCKKIIEQQGGRIWLNSIPGEGTTFYFTLRAAPSSTSDDDPF